jgi:hypothetical protein
LVGCTVDYATSQGTGCQSNQPCAANEACFTPSLENCEGELNCRLMRSRTSVEPQCKSTCDLKGAPTQCPSGQRCMGVAGMSAGICLPGTCSTDEDCGKNAKAQNKCLDLSNGAGSGICAITCTPQRCTAKACDECPASLRSCEPLADQSASICVPVGNS